MKYLLDTTVMLNFLGNSSALPPHVVEIIKNPGNLIALSVLSLWEIADLQKAKKLRVPPNIMDTLKQQKINILDLKSPHIKEYFFIKPPEGKEDAESFARSKLAQAKCEGMKFITGDSALFGYDAAVVRAK